MYMSSITRRVGEGGGGAGGGGRREGGRVGRGEEERSEIVH